MGIVEGENEEGIGVVQRKKKERRESLISNLDLDPLVVWILGQNLNNTPLIVFSFLFYFLLP